MPLSKQHSKDVKKLISNTLENAKHFLKYDNAGIADQAVCKLLAQQEADYLYAAADELKSSANFHGRISIAQFYGGSPYPVNLVDCWEQTCLSAKFREQFSLQAAQQMATPDMLFERVSVQWIPSLINALAFSLWKLYVVGNDKHIKEMVPFFELFDVRQDVIDRVLSGDQLQAYDLVVCVTLLIGRDKGDLVSIGKLLEPLPIFSGISVFWEDDVEFMRFTERAAQWHIEYSLQNLDSSSRLADVPPDILLPSWIFALDEFRQKHLQRPSALGEHELFALGHDLFANIKKQSHPRLQTLAIAEQHYAKLFGNEQFNPLPFWKKFLSIDQ